MAATAKPKTTMDNGDRNSNSNKDNTPRMRLAVVAVAVMLVVVVGGSAMATVEEAATAAAEEAGDWQGGWRLCSVYYFSQVVTVQCILF